MERVARHPRGRSCRCRVRSEAARCPASPHVTMLDTHIAVALYEGRSSGLGPAARRAIDRGKVVISPAVLLELELLHEIGRLRHGGSHVAEYLARELDIPVAGDR